MTIRMLFVLILGLVISSCNFKKKTKDTETNKYWVEYVTIYNNYSKVSLDSTKKALETYLAEYPSDARAWGFMAVILDQLNANNVLPTFQKAIQLDSNLAYNYSGLGAWYGRKSQYDSAIFLMTKAIEKGDSSLQNYANLTFQYAVAKNATACKDLLLLLPIQDSVPDNITFSLAYAYHQIGEKRIADSLMLPIRQKILINDSTLAAILDGKSSALPVFENLK
jgi:tetratricopeptide (TPR) repeat protein